MRRNTRFRYPGGWKSGFGVLAFLGGYGTSYAILAVAGRSLFSAVVVFEEYRGPVTLLDIAGGEVPTLWRVAGIVFYNSQLAAVRIAHPQAVRPPENLLLAAGGPYPLLLALPPAILSFAGWAAVRNVESTRELRFDLLTAPTMRYASTAATYLLLGYLPPVILGLAVFAVHRGQLSIGVDPMSTWVVAGMLYPVLFGGIGGAIASRDRA